MQLPAQVVVLMRQQHGLIARWQLLAAGVSPNTFRTWVARSVLETVERGVYRLPAAARPPIQQPMAAVLRGGAEARAGGWTACALHGLEGFSLRATPWIVVPSNRQIRSRRLIVQRSPFVPADELVVDGYRRSHRPRHSSTPR